MPKNFDKKAADRFMKIFEITVFFWSTYQEKYNAKKSIWEIIILDENLKIHIPIVISKLVSQTIAFYTF